MVGVVCDKWYGYLGASGRPRASSTARRCVCIYAKGGESEVGTSGDGKGSPGIGEQKQTISYELHSWQT